MAGLAGLGHRLHRLELRVRVVARDLVQGQRQDDPDQAGPGGPEVETVGHPQAGPDRQAGPEDLPGVPLHEVAVRGAERLAVLAVVLVEVGELELRFVGVEPALDAGLVGQPRGLELRREHALVAAEGLRVLADVVVVEREVAHAQREEADHADDRPDDEPAVDHMQRVVAGAVGLGLDRVGRDDRPDHADGSDEQGEDHALVPERGVTEDHGGDDRDLITLEDVGGHAGAVADVVPHVVGDGGGVARVVLGDVFFDLPHEVRPHVGGLGVDASADTHEQRQERPAEAEAEEDFIRLLAVHHEDERSAQQAEAVGEHPRDGAGAVAKLQGVAVARARRGGHAQVAPNREAHPDVADGPGERRADEERRGAADGDVQLPGLFAVVAHNRPEIRSTSRMIARNWRAR